MISKESLDLDAIQSPEEASGLLTEAMEHERWSRTYRDFATLQLERAQEDALSAEDQLKTAEEYMCLIINSIRCLGFTVEFIDSQTAAVVKIHDSMFIYYSLWQIINMFIRNSYPLRVGLFCPIFVT